MLRRLACLACLLALAADATADRIPLRQFTTADGLPHEHVQSLVQTPDHRLWIGTAAGLAVYDGYRFTPVVFPDSLGPVNVVEVAAAQEGGVWVATRYQGIWRVEGHRAVAPVPGLGAARAVRIVAAEGRLLIFTADRLCIHDPATGTVVHHPYRYGPEPVAVVDADVGPGGQRWVLDAARGMGRLDADGRITFVRAPADSPGAGWRHLRVDADGRVWATHESSGLYRLASMAPRPVLLLRERGMGHICLTDELVAVTTRGHGVHRWSLATDAPLSSLDAALGLPTDFYDCALRDREGGVWLGSHAGLIRLVSPGAVHRASLDGVPLAGLRGLVQARDGSVWTASAMAGLVRVEPTPARMRPDGEAGWIDLVSGADGHLYALSAAGWYRYSDGRWLQRGRIADARRAVVNANGMAFLARADGLYRQAAGAAPEQLRAWPEDDDRFAFHTLTEAGNVLLWHRGRLELIDARTGDARVLAHNPEYAPHEVNALLSDPTGRVWVSLLSQGLLCLEPDRSMILLRGRQLARLEIDRKGRLIALARDGLYVFELPAAAAPPRASERDDGILAPREREDVRLRFRLTQADGLLSSDVTGAWFGDEVAWVAHPGGLTQLPARWIDAPLESPEVLLHTLERSGVAHAIDAPGAAPGDAWRAGDRNVAFGFNATTLAHAHQTAYRYRLLGYSDAWRESARPFAQYTNLSPGPYRFEVQARVAAASYGPATAYRFVLPPPFYQSPLFWALLAAVLASLLYALHRYRLAAALRVERTRTQIAMDLHDDIGSSLMSLSFLSALAGERLHPGRDRTDDDDEQLRSLLGELGRTSSALVDGLSDIVWAVDPSHDTVESVASRLQAFTQRATDGIAISWSVSPEAAAMALPPRRRRAVYMILKEALSNAIRHAAPDAIEVVVDVDDRHLRATVHDDGCGFATAAGPAAGNGQRTMRVRAEQLGATLSVQSEAGRGTRVALSVPLYN